MAQVNVTFKGMKGEDKHFPTSDEVLIDGVTYPRDTPVPVDAAVAEALKTDEHKWYSEYRFGFEEVTEAEAATSEPASEPAVVTAPDTGSGATTTPPENVETPPTTTRTRRATS
jgi:hypothetical protein